MPTPNTELTDRKLESFDQIQFHSTRHALKSELFFRTTRMPGEIIGEVAGGVIRFIGRIFLEVLFELLIKGAGYLVCRPFKRNVDPDGGLVVVVGLVFWLVAGGIGYAVYREL